ncbi:Coiled-coil domain-containing protein 50 [Sciurus carolinensis]|uniref:Coiled-coil domain-containing protein 50 n=1 Tax=Sciurus carolinensis TaxID=30640 RepID=A0AA41SSH6_SCICA|nr:Coiled-coil domain-containing protein 50 [Sciurus carolinensis]
MAHISIDQSKLPGVKEVCRNFAVLEDHTLAHSLQEQEIEHHLASNIQRNCLVQHDLQEWYDAKIARKLQEEELLATQVNLRASQVAQDEEIARLLMAEEKKAYKKAKERKKLSLYKRKHDSEWKSKTAKSTHPKSKEHDEAHRSKNDRPARPPPPTNTEAEDLEYTHFTNQHNSTHHFSKSESSHKGFHYKQ